MRYIYARLYKIKDGLQSMLTILWKGNEVCINPPQNSEYA